MKNYYKILNVDPLSNGEDIKKAYREQVKKYHPDVSDVENAEDMIREINEAYETLSDPERRRRYDVSFKYLLSGTGEAKVNPQPQEAKQTTRKRRNWSRFDSATEKNVSYAIIAFLIIALIGVGMMLVQSIYLEKATEPKPNFGFGTSVSDVIAFLGEPDSMSNEQLCYDTAIVLIDGGCVVGWYDAYGVLDVDNVDIENVSDIKIGELIDEIIRDYGYPDTYGETFIVYGNVVIWYDHNRCVTEVEVI